MVQPLFYLITYLKLHQTYYSLIFNISNILFKSATLVKLISILNAVVYDFYVIDIPSEVLNKAGSIPVGETRFTATCIIQLLCVLNEESVISLNPVAMAVDSTLLKVAQDFNINVAQWNELIKRVGYILSIIPSEATPIYKHSVVLTTKHNVEEYELTFKIEIITNKDDELSGNEVLNVLNLGELQTQKLVSYRVVNVNLSDVIDLIYLGCNKEQASFVLLDEDTEIYRYISSDDLAVLSVDDSVDKI